MILYIEKHPIGKASIKKRVILWKIGNGRKLLVYKDNWIARPDIFKPGSLLTLLAKTIVGDLINAKNQWDADKPNQHFMHEDTKVILKIPFPRNTKRR